MNSENNQPITKEKIAEIKDAISKSKENKAYINIHDISDSFNIKDPRYIRFVMEYHLMKYGIIVELTDNQQRLALRIATDDELFNLTGLIILNRKEKDERLEPLYTDEDLPEIESVFGTPISEINEQTENLVEAIRERKLKTVPIIRLDVEILSEHDIAILTEIEECIMDIWGYPAGSYEMVADTQGNILYETHKEKEKIMDNPHLGEMFIGFFFVDIDGIVDNKELSISDWNEWKLIPMIKKNSKYEELSQHDIDRLKLILNCFANVWGTEDKRMENIHLQDYIEYFILDLNYMIKEKKIPELFYHRPRIIPI